ncbi:hypothetical protein [Shinella sp. HZN7]|uniref:hypothetical protein n=1 Tax=Shinella sp. (strain HZN7) TaxID=879274 RepID=UPI0007DA6D87|nr:hypothetical protein [Shinella sp. HZN7]ANH09175.1 hypothetical protein shn_34215 [Shinella sp. HZN7]
MPQTARPDELPDGEGEAPEDQAFELEAFGRKNIHLHRVKLWPKTRLLVESPVWLAGNITMRGSIGAYTFLRDGVRIAGQVAHIGRFCSIAPGVVIGDSNHPTEWLSTHSFQWGADSDVKPAGIPINIRPPFRFEAGHDSNQLPAGFRH